MSAMLDRPVTITAAEPDSGRIICVKAGRGRARWRPRTAVVFAGARRRCLPGLGRPVLRDVNLFTSARAARDWAGRHLDVSGRVLRQARALRHGIAEFAIPDDAPSRRSPLTAQSRPLARTVLATTGPGRAARGRPALPARLHSAVRH